MGLVRNVAQKLRGNRAHRLIGKLDRPTTGETSYREQIIVEGWVYATEADAKITGVRVLLDEKIVAETTLLFKRPDVSSVLKISPDVPMGFRILVGIFENHPSDQSRTKANLTVCAQIDGEDWIDLNSTRVQLLKRALETRPYGDIIYPFFKAPIKRENIYSTGAPSENADPVCLQLVESYLPQHAKVLDVGCGVGAYGKELIARQFNWFGIEVFEHLCERLKAAGLPHAKSNGTTLPIGDREFDYSICIEVLEHIPDTDAFLAEIARVTTKRAIFSVPSIEPISMLAPLHVVPWHLLEGDHKNFFTRFNLKHLLEKHFRSVEVFPYGELPVRTCEGFPVYNHLMAVATIAE